MNKAQERRAAARRAAGLPEPEAFADEFIDEPLALEVFRAARDDHPLRERLMAALLYSYVGDFSHSFGSGLNALVSDAIHWAKDAGWSARRTAISPRVRTLIYRRDGYACVQCGNDTITELTVDHRIPVARGGTDDVGNLRTCCRSCNSRKGARL